MVDVILLMLLCLLQRLVFHRVVIGWSGRKRHQPVLIKWTFLFCVLLP